MSKREDGLNLTLIMEKGPLEGQIRGFVSRSGFEIKIGRVGRGNTLAIKDAGISSKHASICFCSHTGCVGFWAISDLGSSNGTFLNGRQLEPFTPEALSDSDVIKMGEWTSIVVKLQDLRIDVEENKARRNPTRWSRNLSVADEKNEMTLESDDGNKENDRGRIRSGKAALKNNEVEEVKWFNEREMASSKRLTRSTPRKRNGIEAENVEKEISGQRACSRRNGRKKEEELDEDGEEMEDLRAKGLQEKGLKNTSLKKEYALVLLDEDELQSGESVEMVEQIEVKGREHLSLRRSGRNLRKKVNMDNLGTSGGANVKRGRGKRRKKNLEMETLTENDEAPEIGKKEDVVDMFNSERGAAAKKEGKGLGVWVEERAKSAAEGFEALPSTGVKENDGIEVNLEKMTIGEWFDFLDAHLPKQIVDATEDMILDMRQKAEKLHDFMLQQKNSNSNIELPVLWPSRMKQNKWSVPPFAWYS